MPTSAQVRQMVARVAGALSMARTGQVPTPATVLDASLGRVDAMIEVEACDYVRATQEADEIGWDVILRRENLGP